MKNIYNKIANIPTEVSISSDERLRNVIRRKDYPESDDPKSLLNVRKRFGYEPVYDDVGGSEDVKSVGKAVFVAVHATAMRYNADLIDKEEDQADEIVKCLDDIYSEKILEKYCGIYKTNPYFGEFDNILTLHLMHMHFTQMLF